MPSFRPTVWRPKDWGIDYIEVEGAGELPALVREDYATCWIYFVQPVNGGPIKIGMAQDVQKRFGCIRGSHWQELRVLGQFWGSGHLEAAMHRRFAAHALKHEWFEDHAELRAAIPFYLASPHRPPSVAPPRDEYETPGYRKRKADVERSRAKREARRAAP